MNRAEVAPRQRISLRRREAISGLLFISPWILSLLLFTSYPVLATFYLGFTEYNVIQPPRFIGLVNYQTMFTADPAFWVAVSNSAIYSIIAVPVGLASALAIALLLNMDVRGIGIYRTLYYLPSLVPPVAATMVFLLIFNPQLGLVNNVLSVLGIAGPGWFLDPNWSKPTLIIMHLWFMGWSALIFVAGLKEVPQSLLEAAQIDGAGPVRRFWHVTVPLISPVILFNLVMGIIYSFQVFTEAFIVGGISGRPLESTLFYMLLIYRNAFRYFSMGYASALALVLFVVVLLITLIVFRTSSRWVHYEGETVKK